MESFWNDLTRTESVVFRPDTVLRASLSPLPARHVRVETERRGCNVVENNVGNADMTAGACREAIRVGQEKATTGATPLRSARRL